MTLSQTEKHILFNMAGYNVAMPWGASTGAALEYLVNAGYVYRDNSGDVYTYLLTEKGANIAETEFRNAYGQAT